MADLKPCPFCGGTDLRLNEFEQYAICDSCNTLGPSFDIIDERDAIAAWNRRATPPEVTALVEALHEIIDAHEFGVGLWRPIENARKARAAWEAAQK